MNSKENYTCPIGYIFMREPVKTPCGHIFEKYCIYPWLEKQQTCPFDRIQVTKEQLVLQVDLQKEINDYLTAYPNPSDEEEYKKTLDSYRDSNDMKSSWQVMRLNFYRIDWRNTMHRSNRLAVICLFVTASTLMMIRTYRG